MIYRIKPDKEMFEKYMLADELATYEKCLKDWLDFTVKCPEDLIGRLSSYKWENEEHLLTITLDSANHIISINDVTRGLVNQTPVHPRNAFRQAILDNASSVIFAHNHPSGSCTPSKEDLAITRILSQAGKIIQIPVLDHIIISLRGATSIQREHPDYFS